MANRHRGQIDAELGGTNYSLCLTLGALAELEVSFGANDVVDLAEKFENGRLSARDIMRIIGCGLRGAGHPISDDELATFSVAEGLHGYARIAADLLAATFGEDPKQGDDADFPLPPQGARS